MCCAPSRFATTRRTSSFTDVISPSACLFGIATIRLSFLHQNPHPQTCMHACFTEYVSMQRASFVPLLLQFFVSIQFGRMAAAWGADGRAYWQAVPFWLLSAGWHWQLAAPWKPHSSDVSVESNVWSKQGRCSKPHTNPRARLLDYLHRSWHELNFKFRQLCVELQSCSKRPIRHTPGQIVEAQEQSVYFGVQIQSPDARCACMLEACF